MSDTEDTTDRINSLWVININVFPAVSLKIISATFFDVAKSSPVVGSSRI